MDEASVFQKIHTDALDKLADANIITGYFRDRIKELLNNKKDFPKGRKYVLDLLAMEHDLQNTGKKLGVIVSCALHLYCMFPQQAAQGHPCQHAV